MKRGTPLLKAILFEKRLPSRYKFKLYQGHSKFDCGIHFLEYILRGKLKSLYLKIFKNYKSIGLNEEVSLAKYRIFVYKENNKKYVLKQLKKETFLGNAMISDLKDQSVFNEYSYRLNSDSKLPIL